ncbi:MAG: permease [Deltaproteobacteria bacterium]|nr:permease [Deltaproteobacteria bacterium]
MKNTISCECIQPTEAKLDQISLRKKLLILPVAFIAWWVLYHQLPKVAGWLTYQLFRIGQGTHVGEAVAFFLYDVPKVLMLLILVVFGVGMLRSFFTPEKTRAILAGKKESVGNVMAAGLGIATPFCTCSAIPLFIGFVEAGVPLGVTLSFLISAPMVNEIALVLLFGLFGWQVAALYLTTGLLIAMVSGWVIGRLRMENHIEDWVREIRTNGTPLVMETMNWSGRIDYAWQAVKDIVGKVWLYVIAGIAVGAAIHGYVPVGFMASVMGKEAWWSVPLAVMLGVPMYSNAAGIIPVVQALLEKGAALGTVLAFMMAVIGLSLPETIILRKVLKARLIAVFVGVVATGILLVGFLFNALL